MTQKASGYMKKCCCALRKTHKWMESDSQWSIENSNNQATQNLVPNLNGFGNFSNNQATQTLSSPTQNGFGIFTIFQKIKPILESLKFRPF
jgi:hypothetical protein